jgi:hypothetical protein
MFKVTSTGVEQGEPWDLNLRDEVEILKCFADVAQPATLAKKNGRWVQVDPAKEYTNADRTFYG